MATKEVAKILREGQYTIENNNRFIVHAPKVFKKTKEQEIDESVMRIEELRSEIKSLEADLNEKIERAEHDAEEIMEKANQETERLIEEAEKSAFDRVQKSIDEQEEIITQKKMVLEQEIEKARTESDRIVNEARAMASDIRLKARREGFEKGMDEGFAHAKEEVKHMVSRLHAIISATLQERERILVHSEQQIIRLVSTMVEKVVKKLTVEEKDMIVNNAKEALSLVRGATSVYIRVNPDDYKYTLKHKEELIKMVEGMPQVKFFEDPTIGRGGCYIETDIGEIDATVATQLSEVQQKLDYYMPVKVKPPKLNAEEEPEETLENSEIVDSKAREAAELLHPSEVINEGEKLQNEERLSGKYYEEAVPEAEDEDSPLPPELPDFMKGGEEETADGFETPVEDFSEETPKE